VEGVLFDYVSNSDFDHEVTVEIGGLTPETSYEFYYLTLNDASACPGAEHISDVGHFTTEAASLPNLVLRIRSIGATGGGIHVNWEPPNDRGSDGELYYQVYMSPSRQVRSWSRVYKDKGTSFWQTKLQKVTEYLFMVSCMNEVGYSINSTIVPLRTTLVSVPGPPSGMKLETATGGTIELSWIGPDDDGGSLISYYSVHAKDLSGDGSLIEEVDTPTIVFGGLLAETKYEFKIYAGNSLGTGSDPAVESFSTTTTTLPSLPGEPLVLESSGGSVTLAVRIPTDTGGIKVDDLLFVVYANGIRIPMASVRRLLTNPTASSKTRRLTESQLLAEEDSFIYVQAGGLFPSLTYTFTVQASNDVGASEVTSGTDGTTLAVSAPGPPVPPSSIYVTGGSLELVWSDPVDTGGAPIISYRLSVSRLGVEVGSCEGLILSCTVGNLMSATDYDVSLVAVNPIGASPPSDIVTLTTGQISAPQAPQRPRISSVSNSSVTMEWDACLDLGGANVDTYLVEIMELSNNLTLNGSVPLRQQNATINGLQPKTDYVATVVRLAMGFSKTVQPA
jgi:hypothetical protein